jgi:hypothetical protein
MGTHVSAITADFVTFQQCSAALLPWSAIFSDRSSIVGHDAIPLFIGLAA